MRVVFLGAGKLAQPVFEALLASHHPVVGLVTQPDRTGAGHHRHVNPLKEQALARGIPVQQPLRIKSPEALAQYQALKADLAVVAAYGQLLSQAVLDAPRLGTINVHASLLPRYRGATPIHAAVLNGDQEAGVTIIRLVMALDAGPMLGSVRTPIGPQETTGALEARLAQLAVPLTLDVLAQLEAGTAVAMEQDHAQATHVGKLTKADGAIPWDQPAPVVECFLRGMQPWPGPFTVLEQSDRPALRLQCLAGVVEPSGHHPPALLSADGAAAAPLPGTIVAVSRDDFTVACGTGHLRVTQVHPDGKRPMPAGDFLRGRPVMPGDRLRSSARLG